MKLLIWLKAHKVAVIVTAAVVAVVALTLGLSLGLTLPVKSVTASGEVTILTGENYTEGIALTIITRGGEETVVPVTADMITGFDPAVAGLQNVTVTYKKYQATWHIRTLGNEDLTLRVREGTLPEEYEPKEGFSTNGIFDLYYNNELFRTRSITVDDAPDFTTRLSREYDIILYYREGLGVPYHYVVPVIVESIEAEGVLLLPQGEALSKSDIVGDVRLHVTYKDGTEEYVAIDDDLVDLQEEPLPEDPDGKDYETEVTFSYKGYEIAGAVTAYSGELLAPRSVMLDSREIVCLQGSAFDYSKVTFTVEYERFGGAPVSMRGTQETIRIAEWQDDPNGDGQILVPVSDGSTPIVFAEAKYYTLIAYYNSVGSASWIRVRVVSEEDASRVTGIETTWNGGPMGPPKKGEDLDYTDAVLRVEYGFGYRYETLSMQVAVSDGTVVVSGYDKEVAGDQTLVITYTEEGQAPVFIEKTIRVPETGSDKVTGIIGVVGWDEPTYWSSDAPIVPENAYLEVEIGYGGQDNGKVFIKGNDAVTITGFTPEQVGMQEISITYADFTVKQRIDVWDDREDDLIMRFSAPHDIYINVGEELDMSGECTVWYSDGHKVTLTLAELFALAEELGAEGTMVGTYDVTVADHYAVRIYYPGFDSTDDFTWIHVEGTPAVTVKGIELDVRNAKTAYKIGEKLDIDNILLYLVYSDGSREDLKLTSGMFSDFSTTVPNATATATVRYVSEKGSYVTTYEYSVEE